MKTYQLSDADVNVIMQALGNAPYAAVAQVVGRLNVQYQQQAAHEANARQAASERAWADLDVAQ